MFHQPVLDDSNGGAARRHRMQIVIPLGAWIFVGIAGVALAALLVFGPLGLFGPGLGPSPAGSATAGAPSSGPPRSSAPDIEPTPSPTPLQTATPVAGWVGLEWSQGATIGDAHDASPYRRADDGSWTIADVLYWRGSWVGVGRGGGDSDFGAAFFASDDGWHWAVSERLVGDRWPEHVAVTPDRLLALSQYGGEVAGLWASSDGTSWSEIDSPTWRAAWAAGSPNGQAEMVASGPAGIVVVGSRQDGQTPGGYPPVILHSIDGQVWQSVALGAQFDDAYLDSLAAFEGGFVVVGGVGEASRFSETGFIQGVRRPAAWFSSDGLSWTAADVEGVEVAGGGLTHVLAGADGLTADGSGAAGVVEGPARWASRDGRTWRVSGPIGWESIGDSAVLASDGTRLVALTADRVGGTLVGWVSADGLEWSPLAMTGATTSVEQWFSSYFSRLWVGPDGVITGGGGDFYNPTQYWYGAARTP
jgi:hypothetical protein